MCLVVLTHPGAQRWGTPHLSPPLSKTNSSIQRKGYNQMSLSLCFMAFKAIYEFLTFIMILFIILIFLIVLKIASESAGVRTLNMEIK